MSDIGDSFVKVDIKIESIHRGWSVKSIRGVSILRSYVFGSFFVFCRNNFSDKDNGIDRDRNLVGKVGVTRFKVE